MTDSKLHRMTTGGIVVLLLLIHLAVAAGASLRVWTCDFVENVSSAEVVRELMTDFRPVSCGQVSKPAIFEHAGILGDELVEVAYSDIPIPSKAKGVRAVYLHFFTGIEDGDAFNTAPGVDGCRFIARVNDKQIFSVRHNRQQWTEHRVNLMRYAGQAVKISFVVDPIRSSTADWAAWGQPRIYVEGTGDFMNALAVQLGQTEQIHETSPIKGPQRITRINKDDKSVTLVAVQDATLDADTRILSDESPNLIEDKQPCRLVAGQGDDPRNHTVVRILSEYGVAEMQYLAYPLYVTGGVQVEAAKDNLGYTRIITAPLADAETCFIRVFNEYGGFVRDISVRSDLSAPFVMDVGNYDADRPGEEIAVVSRHQKAGYPMKILFYGIDGAYITHRRLPIDMDTSVSMTTQGGMDTDAIYIHLENTHQVSILESMDGAMDTVDDQPGMMESIHSEETLDGSVFAVPFANRIEVKQLSTHGVNSENVKDYRIGPLNGLQAGTVIEVAFKAKTDSDGRMSFCIYQGQTLLDGLRQVFAPPVDKWKYYRFIFRLQRPAEGLTLRLQTDHKIQLEDFDATQQTELNALPAGGHITFDILE